MTQDFTYCKYVHIMVCCLFGIAGYQVLPHDTQAVSIYTVCIPDVIKVLIVTLFQCRYTSICAISFFQFLNQCGYYLCIRIYFPHFPPDSTDVPHPADGGVSVVALNETGKVRVTWSRPTLGPGQVITGYSVQYRRSGTTSYTTRSVSGSYTTSYTITKLNLGTVYEVRVASVGPLGRSRYCCYTGTHITTYDRE